MIFSSNSFKCVISSWKRIIALCVIAFQISHSYCLSISIAQNTPRVRARMINRSEPATNKRSLATHNDTPQSSQAFWSNTISRGATDSLGIYVETMGDMRVSFPTFWDLALSYCIVFILYHAFSIMWNVKQWTPCFFAKQICFFFRWRFFFYFIEELPTEIHIWLVPDDYNAHLVGYVVCVTILSYYMWLNGDITMPNGTDDPIHRFDQWSPNDGA